jgi:hypothetical protein
MKIRTPSAGRSGAKGCQGQRNVHRVGLASKAYAISLTPGSARLVRSSNNRTVLELREVWNFADCYQVGVMEGAMAAFRVEGTDVARAGGRPCDVVLVMHWSSAG